MTASFYRADLTSLAAQVDNKTGLLSNGGSSSPFRFNLFQHGRPALSNAHGGSLNWVLDSSALRDWAASVQRLKAFILSGGSRVPWVRSAATVAAADPVNHERRNRFAPQDVNIPPPSEVVDSINNYTIVEFGPATLRAIDFSSWTRVPTTVPNGNNGTRSAYRHSVGLNITCSTDRFFADVFGNLPRVDVGVYRASDQYVDFM